MPVFHDRVRDTSTVVGTGPATLSGIAPIGFQTFGAVFSTKTNFLYCIADVSGPNWETGLGYLSDAVTLVRDTVLDGSSGKSVLVTFTGGAKDVFCTVNAHFLEGSNAGATYAQARGLAMP